MFLIKLNKDQKFSILPSIYVHTQFYLTFTCITFASLKMQDTHTHTHAQYIKIPLTYILTKLKPLRSIYS